MNTLFLCTIACILLSSVLAQVRPPQPEAGPTLTLSAMIRDQAPSYMNHSAYPENYWTYNGWTDYPHSGSCGTANGGKGFEGTDFELPMWMYATVRSPGGDGKVTNGDFGFLGQVCTKNNLASCGKLGADGTPTYRKLRANSNRSINNTVQSAESFRHWFHDTEQTKQVPYNFVLDRVGQSRVYNLLDNSFFPIDNQGWKDSGRRDDNEYHNFAFCVALHASFYYQGGEVFNFTGDDDMFVYIDKKLVIDLGGIHTQLNATVDLDDLDIWQKGSLLDFDMFYCERHTTASNIQITTSLGLLCADYDGCGVCGGNGQSCCKQDYCRNSFPDKSRCYTYKCLQNTNTTCSREPTVCPVIDKCTINTCNEGNGQCQSKPRNDCDKGDKCWNYGCNPETGCTSSPKTCTPSNPCMKSQCDSSDGRCKETPKLDCGESESTPCNQRFCNTTSGTCARVNKIDTCTDRLCSITSCNATTGACQYTPLKCDDGKKCTKDSCNAKGECEYTPIACGGTECTPSSCNETTGRCDSKNLTCADGPCMAGRCNVTADKCLTPRRSCDTTGCEYIRTNCNTTNPCQIGRCNSTDGSCYTTPVFSDAVCLPCNGVPCKQSTDPCKPIVCKGGQCVEEPVTCDNIDACSTSMCVAVNGRASCQSTPVVCSADTAADSCTPVVCDPMLGCINATTTCNDYNPCTIDTCTDSCNSTVPLNACDDNNVCTVDSCNSGANTTVLDEACEHSNITCPPPENACLVNLPCHPVNGCLYEDKVCPQPADFCQVPYCDRNAGCLSVPRGCVVEDPDCYVGVCDTEKGRCTQRERSNFATITSDKHGGKTCMFVYKRKTVAAITGGAAAGIAIGGAVALGLLGYGGKKGYDLWQAHQNTMSSGVSENPLYTPSENAGDNPLYGTDA